MDFNYALDRKDYTIKNALLWGNFAGHCKKAQQGTLGLRAVHVVIAAIELIPVVSQVASLFEAFIIKTLGAKEAKPKEIGLKEIGLKNDPLQQVIKTAPKYNNYQLTLPQGHPATGAVLTGLTVRPCNLFFQALGLTTTLPGSGQLFAFQHDHAAISKHCRQIEGVVAFSANNVPAHIAVDKQLHPVSLATVLGTNTYRISGQEIQATLDSQRIFTSSLLPIAFYRDLKVAMAKDKIVTLPVDAQNKPLLLKELKNKGCIGALLAQVEQSPISFGFTPQNFQTLLDLTLYQIGSMVVKIEDYHLFVDEKFHIIERQPGQNDAIRLINGCGIRDANLQKTNRTHNRQIMTETFRTALKAAETGIAILPAVGMGVWGGDPELYWSAFFDAVIASGGSLDTICVNPGHQKTNSGKYQGFNGNEFQIILDQYLKTHANNPGALKNLQKIQNLYTDQTDIVQLAYRLKLAFPDKIISLFNASDPDVTLGYHVGEYVNNLPHVPTTEENYTAMGTNGLCFEEITGIHESTQRTNGT